MPYIIFLWFPTQKLEVSPPPVVIKYWFFVILLISSAFLSIMELECHYFQVNFCNIFQFNCASADTTHLFLDLSVLNFKLIFFSYIVRNLAAFLYFDTHTTFLYEINCSFRWSFKLFWKSLKFLAVSCRDEPDQYYVFSRPGRRVNHAIIIVSFKVCQKYVLPRFELNLYHTCVPPSIVQLIFLLQ